MKDSLYNEGFTIGGVASDAVSILGEIAEEPELVAVSVTLVALDDDGEIRTITRTWPTRD